MGGWVGGWMGGLPDLMGERPFLRGATFCWRLSIAVARRAWCCLAWSGWVGGWAGGWLNELFIDSKNDRGERGGSNEVLEAMGLVGGWVGGWVGGRGTLRFSFSRWGMGGLLLFSFVFLGCRGELCGGFVVGLWWVGGWVGG